MSWGILDYGRRMKNWCDKSRYRGGKIGKKYKDLKKKFAIQFLILYICHADVVSSTLALTDEKIQYNRYM